MALSVVVMGFRNERTICEAVRSVLEQEVEDAIEVAVVTSGGDRSAELVHARFPGVHVVDSPDRLLPGEARNAGVHATEGEFVAFLAADCRASPDWAAARLAAHRAGYAAVAAAVAPEEPAKAASWAAHYVLFASRLPGARSEEVLYPDDRAHGLSYARELLERLGPFREDMRIGEDTEMARRLGDERVPIWLAADAVITHSAPSRLRELVRDQYHRGVRTAKYVGPPPPRRLSRIRAVLGAVRGVWRRLRWSRQSVRAFAPEHGRNFVRVAPLMVVGLIGRQAGWARGRLAAITSQAKIGAPTNSASTAVGGSGYLCHVPVRVLADLPRPPYTTRQPVVALTFDDGPDPDFTPRVVEILGRYQARATFFMVGDLAARYPEIVQHVAAAGHAVQSHTWGHTDLTQLDPGHLQHEIDETNALLTSLSRQPVLGVRPPYARFTPEIVAALGRRGLATVLWSIDTSDWKRPGPAAIAKNAIGPLSPGKVILLHDGGGDRSQTVEALPDILAAIAGRGYRAVSMHGGGGGR